MKTKFTLTLAVVLGILFSNAQQVPNGGFETWTTPSNPDGWSTWESATGAPLGLATKDTADKKEGNASIKIKTDSVQAGPNKLLVKGFAFLGSVTYSQGNLSLYGTPFTSKPDTLSFSYKYAPVGNDSAYGEMYVAGPSGDLLYLTIKMPSTNGQWVTANIPLTGGYAPGNADSLSIFFMSSLIDTAVDGNQGSVLNVDSVRFGYVNPPVSIGSVTAEIGITVYPNPVSDMITIAIDEYTEGSKAVISDLSGRIVSANNLTGQKTTIGVSELSNGTYIYRVADKTGNVLKQNRFVVVK